MKYSCKGSRIACLITHGHDLHGHNYVFSVLSYIQCCDQNKVLFYSILFYSIIAILIKIIHIFSRDLICYNTSHHKTLRWSYCFAVFKKTISLSLLSCILYR